MRTIAHTSFRTAAATESVIDAVRRITTEKRSTAWCAVDDRSVAFRTRRTLFARPQEIRVVAARTTDGSDVRIALGGYAGATIPTRTVRKAADRLSVRIQRVLQPSAS